MKRAFQIPIWLVLLVFLLVMMGAAVAYSFLPENELSTNERNLWIMLYYSIVTITTLGYGDIIPIGNLSRAISAAESILGIILFGVLLNTIWKRYSDKLNQETNKKIQQTIHEENDRKLSRYIGFFKYKYQHYTESFILTSTEIVNRNDNFDIFKHEFNFQSLKDIFTPSLLVTRDLMKPVILEYLTDEDEIIEEIKYIISNFDLSRNERISEIFHALLTEYEKINVRSTIISYAEMVPKGGGKIPFLETLVRIIEKAGPIPDIQRYPGNSIQPIILLYYSMQAKLPILKQISSQLFSGDEI